VRETRCPTPSVGVAAEAATAAAVEVKGNAVAAIVLLVAAGAMLEEAEVIPVAAEATLAAVGATLEVVGATLEAIEVGPEGTLAAVALESSLSAVLLQVLAPVAFISREQTFTSPINASLL
jgi:hypothetical protein